MDVFVCFIIGKWSIPGLRMDNVDASSLLTVDIHAAIGLFHPVGNAIFKDVIKKKTGLFLLIYHIIKQNKTKVSKTKVYFKTLL